jgi:hypothetical protein
MPHVRRKSGMTTNLGIEGMVTSIVAGELSSRKEVHRWSNLDKKWQRGKLRCGVEVKRKLSGEIAGVELLSISTACNLATQYKSICARVRSYDQRYTNRSVDRVALGESAVYVPDLGSYRPRCHHSVALLCNALE